MPGTRGFRPVRALQTASAPCCARAVTGTGPAICHDDPVTDTTTPADRPAAFDCPRCGVSVTEAFYGPCDPCRLELRATMGNEQREAEEIAYEPKMNVVPNHVATKD